MMGSASEVHDAVSWAKVALARCEEPQGWLRQEPPRGHPPARSSELIEPGHQKSEGLGVAAPHDAQLLQRRSRTQRGGATPAPACLLNRYEPQLGVGTTQRRVPAP